MTVNGQTDPAREKYMNNAGTSYRQLADPAIDQFVIHLPHPLCMNSMNIS